MANIWRVSWIIKAKNITHYKKIKKFINNNSLKQKNKVDIECPSHFVINKEAIFFNDKKIIEEYEDNNNKKEDKYEDMLYYVWIDKLKYNEKEFSIELDLSAKYIIPIFLLEMLNDILHFDFIEWRYDIEYWNYWEVTINDWIINVNEIWDFEDDMERMYFEDFKLKHTKAKWNKRQNKKYSKDLYKRVQYIETILPAFKNLYIWKKLPKYSKNKIIRLYNEKNKIKIEDLPF